MSNVPVRSYGDTHGSSEDAAQLPLLGSWNTPPGGGRRSNGAEKVPSEVRVPLVVFRKRKNRGTGQSHRRQQPDAPEVSKLPLLFLEEERQGGYPMGNRALGSRGCGLWKKRDSFRVNIFIFFWGWEGKDDPCCKWMKWMGCDMLTGSPHGIIPRR